ncbi:MAG: AraC family transcriptional regulator [Clostridiales bacterium]|nr:AraC family transcriptional regulator [Clostridiales bacterium]
MEWIAAMQEAITYMEDHLLEEINYEDVAKHVHTSAYEFHRAFSFLTGITANAYIRNRRLSLAGREIIETDGKITDIALKYGYETPESFTKAFTRFHGVAPKTAREESGKLVLFSPLNIRLTVDGGKSMDYRIVQTEAKKFIALTRTFKTEIINDDENHEIPDFWAECNQNQLLGPIWMLKEDGNRDLYGLCTPTPEGATTFKYGIGILIEEDTPDFDAKALEGKGFEIWDVKPGTYVVFDCVGENADVIGETWEKFYKEFLPQSGYEAVDEADYELYFDDAKGRPGLICELWIPIKKK